MMSQALLLLLSVLVRAASKGDCRAASSDSAYFPSHSAATSTSVPAVASSSNVTVGEVYADQAGGGGRHGSHSSGTNSASVTSAGSASSGTTAATSTSVVNSLDGAGSSTTSSAASTSASSSSGSTTSSDCSCGYVLAAYDSVYYPYAAIVDFSTLSDQVFSSMDGLKSVGFTISDGWQIGATSTDGSGTICYGSPSNLAINGGILELTVPGGQTADGSTSGAEMSFSTAVTGGVFTMDAMIDGTPGTCQSIFTYRTSDANSDEQDIEILGSYLTETGDNGTPPGIELTNWDPEGAGHTVKNSTIVPFSVDPTTDYHSYTIGWLPDATRYYFDSTELDSPTQYFSVDESKLIINHWTNGDAAFTQGPPTTDVVLKVKSVAFYYETSSQSGLLSGCSLSDACSI